jgi:hypothetical protein
VQAPEQLEHFSRENDNNLQTLIVFCVATHLAAAAENLVMPGDLAKTGVH